MTINMLLVDDEKIDLEWLRRRIVNSGQPINIVGTANSGFTALSMIEQQMIHVILSDIRMPIMSGIEFARKAKAIQPHVKIVFISGHEDFGYAKEAIQLSACGYLLKPVDDQELYHLLEELCLNVAKEQEQTRSFSETLSLASQELLLRWLNGGPAEQLDPHLQPLLSPFLQSSSAAALIEIDDLEWKARDLPDDARRRATEGMTLRIRDFVELHGLGTLIASAASARLVLLTAGTEERIAGLLKEMIDEIGRAFPFTVTIGCGKFAPDWRRLPESYAQAQAALSVKWLIGKNRLIRDAAQRRISAPAVPNIDETVVTMLQAVLSYDLVVIDDCLLRIFGPETQLTRKDDVYNLIIRVTSKLHADLQQLNENLYELLAWESHQPVVLFQFETVGDILSWLRRRFFELSELLFAKRKRQNRKLIDEIMRFVEERVEQKITLKEAAAHFDFTPNYMGYLFKEETGMHFSEFLIEGRMRRVCQLLTDPTLKIYEVADRVGYKNIIYFNRQFKQSTGMTPGEYRKKHNI